MIAKMLPNFKRDSSAKSLMEPILAAWHKDAYPGLETAIFPSYFHGKCQRGPDLVEPNGCPNPDCPVICGTPGSMVHFYATLTYIAYNETSHQLKTITRPGTKAYQAVERNVISKAQGGSSTNRRRRNIASTLGGTRLPRHLRHEQKLKDELRRIMNQMPLRLEKACGGSGTGAMNGLPNCSWEKRMKEYILSYP